METEIIDNLEIIQEILVLFIGFIAGLYLSDMGF